MALSTSLPETSPEGSPECKLLHPSKPHSNTSSESCYSDAGQKEPVYSYLPGATFTLAQHKPPPPFGVGYRTPWKSETSNWEELTKLEYCLSRKPQQMNDDKSGGRKIKITSILVCGYERGAQIVAIQGGLVAKIYDPLYYQWINRFGRKMDIVREADADYSHEAAAYEHLKKQDEARKHVPRYEGSWIMNVKTIDRNGQQRQRSVRLILIEHLDGIRMDGIYPHRLSREVRRSILIKVIDAESTIYHAGVNHADFSPRNIFLVGNDLFSNDLKIKIHDFNIAVVRPLRGEVYQKRERMENPVRRFWYGLDEFVDEGWLSSKEGMVEKWLWLHFRDAPGYIPMRQDNGEPVKDGDGVPMQEEVDLNVVLPAKTST